MEAQKKSKNCAKKRSSTSGKDGKDRKDGKKVGNSRLLNPSSYTDSGIPRRIHQIWFQGEENMPTKYLPFQQRLKELHPNYHYFMWSEKTIRLLLKDHYSWFHEIWENLPTMIQKIDSSKIFILHKFGGIYIDLDMEALMNVEPLLTHPLVLSRCYVHPVGRGVAAVCGLPNFSKTTINNGFIACTKEHIVMENTIYLMKETTKIKGSVSYGVFIAKTCGTEVMIEGLRQELERNPSLSYVVYPPEFFEPKVKIQNKEPLVTKNTHVIHHSDRSWIKDSPVAKIQLLIFITMVVLFCAAIFGAVIAVGVKAAKKNRIKFFKS